MNQGADMFGDGCATSRPQTAMMPPSITAPLITLTPAEMGVEKKGREGLDHVSYTLWMGRRGEGAYTWRGQGGS